jgi:hypothetical protein
MAWRSRRGKDANESGAILCILAGGSILAVAESSRGARSYGTVGWELTTRTLCIAA